MSREYIPISKKYFKRVARESVDIAVKIHEIKSSLKAIQSIINLTDEEIKIFQDAVGVLENKADLIEEIMEDPNYEFYNIDEMEDYN